MFIEYQKVADDRCLVSADVGELTRQFVDVLVASGWTERDARNANVDALAAGRPGVALA